MAGRDALIAAMDRYLKVAEFTDYAPIGLQVEGAARVTRVVTGVSMHMELLRAAARRKAQMVLVHHGLFWNHSPCVLKGPMRERAAFLLEHGITLAAYHLPLDAHPVVGNNARILRLLRARRGKPFGEYKGREIGFAGTLERGLTYGEIAARLAPICPGKPLCFPGRAARVKRVAVVSGGAGDLFEQAVEEGFDLYITGEPWEPAQALVRETGTGFMALGHYNSEKPGVQALGAWLGRRFKVAVEFVDVPNPA